jgi:hypothetical protein
VSSDSEFSDESDDSGGEEEESDELSEEGLSWD